MNGADVLALNSTTRRKLPRSLKRFLDDTFHIYHVVEDSLCYCLLRSAFPSLRPGGARDGSSRRSGPDARRGSVPGQCRQILWGLAIISDEQYSLRS